MLSTESMVLTCKKAYIKSLKSPPRSPTLWELISFEVFCIYNLQIKGKEKKPKLGIYKVWTIVL